MGPALVPAGGIPGRLLGLILAGGRSRRMGTDKSELLLSGERLVDRAARILLAAGAAEVAVSCPHGAPESPGQIPDEQEGAGPLGGIASVARARPDAAFLLAVAVDQPRLSPGLLARLAALAGQDPPPEAASYAGLPLPLLLHNGPGLRAALGELLGSAGPSRERSLRALLERLGAAALEIPQEERGAFASVNTREEWRELLGS